MYKSHLCMIKKRFHQTTHAFFFEWHVVLENSLLAFAFPDRLQAWYVYKFDTEDTVHCYWNCSMEGTFQYVHSSNTLSLGIEDFRWSTCV